MSGSGLLARCPRRYRQRFEADMAAAARADHTASEGEAWDRAMAEAYPGYLPDYITRRAEVGPDDEGEFSLEDLLP